MKVISVCVLIALTVIAVFASCTTSNVSYPYHSRQFTKFVYESYCVNGTKDISDFYTWMEKAYKSSNRAYPGKEKLGLESLMEAKRCDFSHIKDINTKTTAQINFASWLHRTIKTIIPRFSLDRGFEFCNVVRYGERQCFLQSVLIAGLLQKTGVNAGVVMVYKNIKGAQTNNGHAVVLVKLPDGKDIIVDASEPEPFARQRGLFVKTMDYRYVDPVFEDRSDKIVYFKPAYGTGKIGTSKVKTLDTAFLDSQFWYYRGERVVGGIIASKKTHEGLARSASCFETSMKRCPNNPLTVYMLGRVYLDQGRMTLAKQTLNRAKSLYMRFGWVPDGMRVFLAKAQG